MYPAADRVAEAIVAVIDSATDPRSAEAWGQSAIASAGALRGWCRASGMHCHDALCFARMLRACHLALAERSRDGVPVSPSLFLDIVDDRYRAAYLQRAGVPVEGELGLDDFLQRQQFLNSRPVVDAVGRLLSARTDRGNRFSNS